LQEIAGFDIATGKHMRISGKLIALSGIDRAGKSTQIALLTDYLRSMGKPPLFFWSRGGYTGNFLALKQFFRKIFKKSLPRAGQSEARQKAFEKPFIRNLWLALAICDLILIYGLYFRLMIFRGKVVVADRYIWDTWIDFRINFSDAKIDRWPLWKALKRLSPKPDVNFMFLIPVAESLRRSKLKKEPFPDSKDILDRRLVLYQQLTKQFDFHIIDGLQPVEDIQRKIIQAF
jgi:dTMP kinase